MEEYILTADGHILSRQILFVIMFVKGLIGYGNFFLRFRIPPKLYHGIFLAEMVALTAYVVWCCVNEPFEDGIFLAVCGYAIVYVFVIACWLLSRHLMVSHTKIYEMIPYRKFSECKVVEGYIREGGFNIPVVVCDDDLYNRVKDNTPVKVKFLRYSNTPDIDAIMEEAKE